MANNRSAQKRIEIAKRNRLKNRFYISSVKNLSKKFQNSVELFKYSQKIEDKSNSQKLLSSVYSLIDKGTKRRVFHRNNAARRKSRLAKSLRIG